MSYKRKLMQEDKRFLLEKIHLIEERQQWLIATIQDHTTPALTEAKKLLEETDQKRFVKRLNQVSMVLESSLRTLALLTAACPSPGNGNDNDSDCTSSVESIPDSTLHDDDASVFSSMSTTTASSPGSVSKAQGPGTKAESLQIQQNPLAAKSSKSPPHVCDTGRSNSDAVSVHVSSAKHLEGATISDKARVPPGFEPVCSHSATADLKTEFASDRVVSAKELNLPPSQEPSQKADAPSQNPTQRIGPSHIHVLNPAEHLPSQTPCSLPYQITKEKQTAVIMPLELKAKGQIEAIVTEVVSPAVFWIQLADSTLESFSQRLNQFYSNYMNIPIPVPELSIFCCACFTQDDNWYRARIVGVQDQAAGQPPNLNDLQNTRVDVIYVDYGNRERLNLTRVRVIHPDFTRLPAQSICCSIAKIKPPVIRNGWAKEQIYFFQSLVLGKTVQSIARINKGHQMPSLDISVPVRTRESSHNGCQYVHVDVAQTMVEKDMAQYMVGCSPPKAPLQPRVTPEKKHTDSRSLPLKDSTKSVEVASQKKKAEDTQRVQPSKQESHKGVKGASKNSAKEESSTPGKSAEQATGDRSKSQSLSGAISKRGTNRFLDGYSDYEDAQSDPFPRTRHHSSSSWRDVQHPGNQPKTWSGRHQAQSKDPIQRRDNQEDKRPRPELKPDCRQKAAEKDSGPPQSQHSSAASPTRASLGKSQPNTPRRQGAWTGRGGRLNAKNTVTPHNPNKVEQKGHQEIKPADPVKEEVRKLQVAEISPPNPRQDLKDLAARPTTEVLTKDDNESTCTCSTTKEGSSIREETMLGRISPNSSSGVSSCNSGNSDSSAKKISKQPTKQTNKGLPHKNKKKQSLDSKTDTGRQDNPTWKSRSLLESDEELANSTRKPNLEGKDNTQPTSLGLNKPLSTSSTNLSSSSSSFFSTVTELDTFQTDVSGAPQKTLVASGPVSTTSASSSVRQNITDLKLSSSGQPKLFLRDTLPANDGCVQIVISHIESPGEFYAHLITPDIASLDYLAEELNSFYTSDKADAMTEELVLAPGRYCAAKFSEDGIWYRAKILSVETVEKRPDSAEAIASSAAGIRKVQLFYLDFGNKEWLPADAIKPLQALFYELPGQVVKFCLAHVHPPEDRETGEKPTSELKTGTWSEKTIAEFKQITKYGHRNMLLGRLTREYEPYSDEPVPIILLDPASPWEICINQELVNHGLAVSSKFVPAPPSEKTSKRAEVTNRQLLLASEGWHLKQHVESGYDPVPYEEGHPEAKGQGSREDNWNPMKADFESARNSYAIDVDDPGVATVGYKAESTRQVCKFYSSGRVCYRGSTCPHEHVKPGERPLESVDVFYSDIKVALPRVGSVVALEVTALYNAFHFWAQLPYSARPLEMLQQQRVPSQEDDGEETLDLLEKALNQRYLASKHHRPTSLLLRSQGEMVCCRSPQDHRCYRARVIEVDTERDVTQVFYVDYGNNEWVPSSDIYDIQQEFLHLPLQAIECRLVGARPLLCEPVLEAGTRPDQEARKLFEELVSNKTLVAHIVYAGLNDSLEVELYDTTGKSDINIAEVLIEHGLAISDGQSSCRNPFERRGPFERQGTVGGEQSSSSEAGSGAVMLVPG